MEPLPRPVVVLAPPLDLDAENTPGGVRERDCEPAAVICGNRLARSIRYCARDTSILSTATRKSRLLRRASSTSFCSCGSPRKSRQPISEAASAPGCALVAWPRYASPVGKVADTG